MFGLFGYSLSLLRSDGLVATLDKSQTWGGIATF